MSADHDCLKDTCSACAERRLQARADAARYKALDEALAIVQEDWKPKYNSGGCCVVCEAWSYRDLDNHRDGCAAMKEYYERRDKVVRIQKLLAPRDVARELNKITAEQERQKHAEECEGCCPCCHEHCPETDGTSCGAVPK